MAVATGTGLSANARYLPMGFAIAPSLQVPAWRRAISGALLADASHANAQRRDGGFDTAALEGATPWQYAGWGRHGYRSSRCHHGHRSQPIRVRCAFPVFYLGLLLPEVRGSARAIVVTIVSAAVTIALIPVAPEGVPVLAGASAALLGLRKPA